MDGEKQSYQLELGLKGDDLSVSRRHVEWVFMESSSNGVSDSESIESTFDEEDSVLSSSSSSEMAEEEEDETTSSSTTSLSNSPTSSGPLYELSELMAQLPIKRGLSKYYQGKSQSFTSLGGAKSLEDLAKKESPYRKRVKPCKRYGPKAIITKRSSSSSRGSVLSLKGKRGTIVGTSCHRPSISIVQN